MDGMVQDSEVCARQVATRREVIDNLAPLHWVQDCAGLSRVFCSTAALLTLHSCACLNELLQSGKRAQPRPPSSQRT